VTFDPSSTGHVDDALMTLLTCRRTPRCCFIQDGDGIITLVAVTSLLSSLRCINLREILTLSIFPVCVVNCISLYKLGRLRTLFFDDSFILLLDLEPLHVSAVL
jgi:hypothetical protein